MNANPLSSPSKQGATPMSSPHSASASSMDPMRILRQWWWVLALSVVLGFGLGVGLWLLLLRTMPGYTTATYLLVDSPLRDTFDAAMEAGVIDKGSLEEIEAYMENQIITLSSIDLLQTAIENPKVKGTEWYKMYLTPQERLDTLLANIRPLRMRNSTVIEVKFSGPNEEDPPIILDTVIDLFLSRYVTKLQTEGGRLRMMLDDTRRAKDNEISNLQKDMVQYREDHDLETLSIEKTGFAVQHHALAEDVAAKKVELENGERYYNKLLADQENSRIVPTPRDLAQARMHPLVQDAEMRVSRMREQREILRQEGFADKHRSRQRLENQMRATELEREREMNLQLRRIRSVRISMALQGVEILRKEVDGLHVRLDEMHNQMMDLVEKIKDYKVMEKELEMKELRREEIHGFLDDEQLRRKRPDVNLITRLQASTDAELSFPKIIIIVPVITLFIFGLTTGLVFLKERLDQRIKTPNDLKLLSGADLLGIVPDVDEDPSGPAQVEGVVTADPTGLMAESFRQVRSAIITRMDRNGYKTLVLCGVQARCGVSAVISNLALSMGFNGRRVVIVDANLRRPAQHELFNAPPAPGLIELLKGSAKLDDIIFRHEDPAIDVIVSGSTSDALPELLEGSSFKELLSELEKRYDIVLIDAPPALLASDSMMISKHADAIALVVRAMSEKRGLVVRMLNALREQRTDVIGIILNGARSSAGGYFRKNYREFYRYRQTDDRKRRRKRDKNKEKNREQEEAAATTDT